MSLAKTSKRESQSTLRKHSHQSSMVDLQQKGIDPVKEHDRVQSKLKFPLNPAFFKTSLQDRQTLQSMNAYCRTIKLPLNKQQNLEYMSQRAKQSFEHYTQELDRIVKGHRDQDFEDSLV